MARHHGFFPTEQPNVEVRHSRHCRVPKNIPVSPKRPPTPSLLLPIHPSLHPLHHSLSFPAALSLHSASSPLAYVYGDYINQNERRLLALLMAM